MEILLKVDYTLSDFSLNNLSICITTCCQMKCKNCHQLCDVAQNIADDMTIRQVELFLLETIALDKKWERIRITGGEPTLHPNVLEIANLLLQYKYEYNQNVELGFTTNGIGKLATKVLNNLPEEYKVTNTEKDLDSTYKFVATLNSNISVVPIDHTQVGCDRILLHKNCSRFLSAYGFYACPVALAFDRVLGKDLGIKSLNNLTRNNLITVLQELCGSCGYKKMKKSRYTLISEDWKKQIAKYNTSRPILTRYGG